LTQIPIKTQAEIEVMRRSGKILANLLQELKKAAKPGVTTKQLDAQAQKICKETGTEPTFLGYRGYPAALCTSVNNEVVHTIPNDRPLEDGDLLSIDCGVTLEGLITDSAISFIVGEKENPEATKLIKVAKKALQAGIDQARPGRKIGDIGNAIQTVVHNAGYHIVRELTGHGVGHKLHEPPIINNFGKKGTGPAMKPGMTFAIEPIIAAGTRHTKTLDDKWTIITQDDSLAIQVEHTILITSQGNEILTLSTQF